MLASSRLITLNFVIFIVLGSTVAQVATQITMPILPAIASAFHVKPRMVQLSLTAYLMGMALSGIFFGYLSDCWGRRKVMLIALSIGVLGTLFSILAPSVYVLILGRFIQGVGLSGVWIISRAVIRDKSVGAELARLFSVLAILDVLIICVSPLVGGICLKYFGWRSVFGVFLLYNVLVIIMTTVYDKVNTTSQEAPLPLAGLLSSLKMLARDKIFQPFNICASCIYATHMVYASVGGFIFEKKLGLSPTQFGFVALLISVAYILGAFINSRLVMRLPIKTILFMAIGLMWISIILLSGYAIAGKVSLVGMLIFTAMDSIAGSIILLNGLTMALCSVEKGIGSCSAFMSTSQFIVGGIFSAIMSCFTIDSLVPLAGISAVIALIISWMSVIATYPERSQITKAV